MWIVMCVHKAFEVVGGIPVELNWADGMMGALPVFDTKAKAYKYAMGVATVVEATEIMPEHTA